MGAIFGGVATVAVLIALDQIGYTMDYYFSGGSQPCHCDFSDPWDAITGPAGSW